MYSSDYADQATAKFTQMRDQQARRESRDNQPQTQYSSPSAGSSYLQTAFDNTERMQHENRENTLHAIEAAGAIYAGAKLVENHLNNRQAPAGQPVRVTRTIPWGWIILALIVVLCFVH